MDNFFSIIIPLYNKGEYIDRAIQSVLNQTYQNFELIVVNDGSTDNSNQKTNCYTDDRITLIDQKNQGVSVARNNGINKAIYKNIAVLDADDCWEATFLMELNNLINLFPDAGLYGINNYYHYENGEVSFQNYDWLFNGNKNGIIDDFFLIFSKLGKSPFPNSGTCFPIEIFRELGGYKAGVKITEDSDFWCRIALNHKVAFHINPLVNYYLETPNNTRSFIEYKDFQVSTTLQNLLKRGEVPAIYIKSVKKLIAFQQLSLVKRAILTGNNKFALRKLFDFRIISNYPFVSILHLGLGLIPHTVFIFLRRLLKNIS
ncbi:MAG: glycosyltransferase family 2 protein [Paludibacter sp.]|nr:glycosyltransferase family 2 protein [Paludibacter sp.]